MSAHVSLGYKKKKDPDLIPFAQGVHDGLAGHAALFPSLPVTLVALQAAITDFTTKFNASIKGGVAQTEAKDLAREALLNLLNPLAAYVEGVALGNADTIRAAGFDVVVHQHHTPTPLAKPDINKVLNRMTTQLVLQVSSVPNAQAYEVQYRIGTGAWQAAGAFSQAREIVLENLTPGTLYEIRVRAVGGSTGWSDWSDPVSHMCI